MITIEAKRIKAHCEANGYQMVYQPGIDTFRAFKTICHRGDYTVILTMNNRRPCNGKGIIEWMELRRLITDVEQLKELEIDEPMLKAAGDYFFEI